MDITFYLFFIALLISLAGWCVFLWGIRTGQFDDVEESKYQVWPKSPDDRVGPPAPGPALRSPQDPAPPDP